MPLMGCCGVRRMHLPPISPSQIGGDADTVHLAKEYRLERVVPSASSTRGRESHAEADSIDEAGETYITIRRAHESGTIVIRTAA